MTTMDEARWAQVRAAFDAVVDRPLSERDATLESLGTEDPELRRWVEALLDGDERVEERLAGVEPPAPSADPLGIAGRTVSHFRVLEPLGAGGMGVVYRAEDVRLGRPVALKFLLPHVALDPDAKLRFLHEARATAVLDHPNVCTVHEVGETDDGRPFLAMSLYEGETLRARLSREGALPVDLAVEVAAQIARGLARAHAAGIVHRDLKPANVILTPDGVARILDFGLAKARDVRLTATGLRVGTLAYMAPEQLAGDAVDARTDLWALGAVLYEMLAGRPPAGRSDVRAARPDVPERVARVVARLLRPDPDARYPSADAVLADLVAGRDGPDTRRRVGRRTVAASSVVLLVVALVAWGAAMWRRGPPTAGVATSGTPSIAVLPLRNTSGDAAQEYFSDGMTEELTTTLAKIEGLRVIAHQSVRQFRGSDRSAPEIARALGVRHVVEGSVLQGSDRVRIIVTLIDAATNTPVLSERFERDRRDVLALQREIALALADRIAVTLTARDRERLAPARPVDPVAFDLYMKGTQARYLTSIWVGASPDTAAEYFRRAIARDSTFAPAYAGLALIHAFGADDARARASVRKALALDQTLAEAHVALAILREMHDRDWEGAERALEDAIRFNPGYAEAHHELSMLLLRVARFDEAESAARRSIYLAPTSARFHGGLGEVYLNSGRQEEALRAADEAFARDSSAGMPHLMRAFAYTELRRYAEAESSYYRFERISSDGCRMRTRVLAYLHARAGATARAREIVRVCADSVQATGGVVTAYGIALVHAALGERERALAWLERAADLGTEALMYLAVEPALEPLHDDPRFRAVVRRVGLPESALSVRWKR